MIQFLPIPKSVHVSLNQGKLGEIDSETHVGQEGVLIQCYQLYNNKKVFNPTLSNSQMSVNLKDSNVNLRRWECLCVYKGNSPKNYLTKT